MILSTVIPPALAAMAAYPQWICWDLVQKPDKPKPDKVPVDPRTRFPIDAQHPSAWMTAEIAANTAAAKKLGIGFVFTENDPFFFLDIDECATPNGPQPWADHAYQLLSLLPGAAVETSCSGRGLHVFGRCPRGLVHSNKNKALHIELYTSRRFVALGYNAIGDANVDCSAGFTQIAQLYFPPTESFEGVWTEESQPGSGISDDQALINKAFASMSVQSTFGDKASFKDLWEANDVALTIAYPDPNRAYDSSSADMALAAHLAFWTGGNCAQIWRIMWRSGLVRDKWYARENWLATTIMKAVAGCRDFYRGAMLPADKKRLEQEQIAEAQTAQAAPPPVDMTQYGAPAEAANQAPIPITVPPAIGPSKAAPVGKDEVTVIDSYPYASPEMLRDMWQDYIYVLGVNRVMTPQGTLINESQFKTIFGHHVYALDHTGKDTTTDAWKAYTRSRCWTFRVADRLCFKPMNFNLTIKEGREVLANTWRDPEPKRVTGDPARFVSHIYRMLPNGDDAARLLAYMAACVQHQGVKFAWCPLIQGVQGNGKSMAAMALMHAIGEKYVHIMKGISVNSQFNGWVQDRTLVIVEDIHMGGSESAVETIKPLITAQRMQVERKGFDQTTEDIVCNFVMTTNHQDAIPLDPNERRWAMFFCSQQSKADMLAQGMTKAYFESLWNWLREEGFAIVAEYLWTYPIPEEMNPATGCMTAPETTMHQAAIEASRSPEAQFIADAILSEEKGFMGGWVSSTKANSLLRENRYNTSPRKLSTILERMGYVKHPGLVKGRSPRFVAVESGRPTFWVMQGHASKDLTGSEVPDAYEKAQGYPAAKVLPIKPT